MESSVKFFVAATLCVAALLLEPQQAVAQAPVSSFAGLVGRVSLGDTITVTDEAGLETSGRISKMSASDLEVFSGSAIRSFEEGSVRLIQRRRADSVLNGLGIGAAAGALPALGLATALDCNAECAPFVLFWTGVGAGIGTLVDAWVRPQSTIYLPEAPRRRGPRVNVGPVLSSSHRGFQATLRF